MNHPGTKSRQTAVHYSRHGERRRIVVLGGYMEWVLTPAETNGLYCVLESFIPPGAGVPPHQHLDWEAFYVLEGSVEFARSGGEGLEWFAARVGDSIYVPSNEVHAFRNASTTPVRALVTGTAGLGEFFEEAGTPLPPGGTLPSVPPSRADVERVLMIARRHGHRFMLGKE
jgi:quercetin dioxygenase-like cupin family protein